METKLFCYFDNTLPEHEVAQVEAWINSSEENRKLAEQLYWLHYATSTLHIMKSVNTQTALRKVRGRIAASRRRVVWNRIVQIAAVLFLPVAAVAFWTMRTEAPTEEGVQYVEMKTTSGMISSITLPDSSKVWLNSNSYLKYPIRFEDERRVKLVGEGYFKVAKDDKRRFVVETDVMEIEVTGTEFNVDAYDRSGRDVRTTLVSGSINMTFDGNDNREHHVEIHPGHRVTIDPASMDWNIRRVNTVATASWKDGCIVFDNTPLAEALRMIENRFNVEFVVKNPKYYEHNFTGMFTDQRLDIILEHFKRSSNMRFRSIERNKGGNLSGYELIEIY